MLFKKKQKILHIAPSSALKSKLLKSNFGTYIDVDINPARARFVENIEKLSFRNDSFDLIICSHVLAHVENEEKSISELYRVLSSTNGICIIVTKTFTVADPIKEIKLNSLNNDPIKRIHDQSFGTKFINNGFKAIDPKSILERVTQYDRDRLCIGNTFHDSYLFLTK